MHLPPEHTTPSAGSPYSAWRDEGGRHSLMHPQLRHNSSFTSLEAEAETRSRKQHGAVDGNQAEAPWLPRSACRRTFPSHAVVPLKLLPCGCCLPSAGGSVCADSAGSALGKTHQDRSDQMLQDVYNNRIGSASRRLLCCQIPGGSSPAPRRSNGQ